MKRFVDGLPVRTMSILFIVTGVAISLMIPAGALLVSTIMVLPSWYYADWEKFQVDYFAGLNAISFFRYDCRTYISYYAGRQLVLVLRLSSSFCSCWSIWSKFIDRSRENEKN